MNGGRACRYPITDVLGVIYQNWGRTERAEPVIRRSLRIYEKTFGPESLQGANPLLVMGGVYGDLGDHESAEAAFKGSVKAARAALGPDHQITGYYSRMLGKFYVEQRRFTEAEPLLKKALEVSENSSKSPTLIAFSLADLASLYIDSGEVDKAEPLIERSLALRRSSLPAGHLQIAGSLESLAQIKAAKGGWKEAEDLYRSSQAIGESVSPRLTIVREATFGLAEALWNSHRWNDALTELEHLEELQESQVKYLVPGLSERRRLELFQEMANPDLFVSFHLQGRSDSSKSAALAFRAVVRRKGRALADSVAESRASRDADGSKGSVSFALNAARQKLATLVFSAPSENAQDEYRAELAALQGQIDLLDLKQA